MKYIIFFFLIFTLNAAPVSRQSILKALNNTVVKEIALDDFTIEEIIKILHDRSGSKINFVYLRKPIEETPNAQITNNIPQIIDPLTGLPFVLPPVPRLASQEFKMPRIQTVQITLKNVTLQQVLDVSVACFDQPMKYVIADFGIVFMHREKGEKSLFSRRFKVNPNIFKK